MNAMLEIVKLAIARTEEIRLAIMSSTLMAGTSETSRKKVKMVAIRLVSDERKATREGSAYRSDTKQVSL